MTDTELARLADAFGTPFYVFDARAVRERIKRIEHFLPPYAKLCFAVKANPFVIPNVAPFVSRLEVCSPGEMRICDACRIDPVQIVVSGVYKDADLMRELVQRDDVPARFTVESLAQLELLNSAGLEAGKRIAVLVRLSSGNQFGVDAHVLRSIVANRSSYPGLDVRGIQFFSGTQKTRPRLIKRELGKLAALVRELEQTLGWRPCEIEYGAGLPVAYFAEDAVDEEELLGALGEGVCALEVDEVTIELGRSLVASCGTYLTRVVDTKLTAGRRYAIVDGGMHHLVYYGQSMAMRLPPVRLVGDNNGAGAHAEADTHHDATGPWTLCGALCSVNDLLVKQWDEPALAHGSLVAFDRAGAYCMTEGISLFLSRDLPAVVVIDERGQPRAARDRTPTYVLNMPAQGSADL